MPRVLVVFGTRPEAIKLAPLIRRLRLPMSGEASPFEVRVAVTAQHREMLDQVLEISHIHPDYDLNLMQPRQSLHDVAARTLSGLQPVLDAERPDWVVVQGDTTTAFAGAMAAAYSRIKVAHVEAGLRTGDREQPFPEEINRVLVGHLAALHFAPTATSARNLRREGIPRSAIHVTGNTGIDAVLEMRDALEAGEVSSQGLPRLDAKRKTILVTGHRRESFGPGFERICQALRRLSDRDDVEVVYPVHPNPNVQEPVRMWLADRGNIHLIQPLDYVSFVDLMRKSYLILTDSGGIQEEAPSLGKPVLVMRDKTERPEAVEAGTARLVGTDPEKILAECELLLDRPREYEERSLIRNPYGDGTASRRIRDHLLAYEQGQQHRHQEQSQQGAASTA